MKTNLETLVSYENKVIDLSRRNRLLKFPKNAKRIDFDMNLKELLAKFGSLEELCIEFPHKQILEQEKLEEQAALIPLDETRKSKAEEKIYIPPTHPSGERLINLLNNLRLETKRKFEEHGLHTLFLAIGKVRWKEPSIGSKKSGNVVDEYDYNAPLLLVPIHITEKKNPKKTEVFTYLETGDITPNKVLGLLLQKEYNSRHIALMQEVEDDWLNTYNNLVLQVKEIFAELKLKHEISDEIQIGQYSFFGQQIYEDLHKNEGSVIKNDFINALCTHSQLQQDNLDIKLDYPDATLTADTDYNVKDADISQLEVIHKAVTGNHLNIQGPPGTGKSQTIVNLISNLLAKKKTVLVVCEKQVALEVVLERLKSTGLDKLCLPLFHYNADKKLFAKSVINDREAVIKMEAAAKNSGDLNLKLTNRTKRINQLRAYASALGQVSKVLGKSLFWVHGELSKHKDATSDEPVTWSGKNPLEITFDDYRAILGILDSMAPVFNISSETKHLHWQNINRQNFSPDFINRVNHTLNRIKSLVLELKIAKLKLGTPLTIADIKNLAAQGDVIEQIIPVPTIFQQNTSLTKSSEIINRALVKIEGYNALSSSFNKRYKIPNGWDHTLLSTLHDHIADKISIEKIENASTYQPVVAKKLEDIKNAVASIHGGQFIFATPLQELMGYQSLLLLDPSLKLVRGWDNLDSLQSITEQLNNLYAIYTRLNEVKRIFDKWAIIPTELESSVALAIGNRFELKYRNFLRYLRPQYRKDCQAVAVWCNAALPKNYQEYVEVANGATDFFRMQNKLKILVDNFQQQHMLDNATLQSFQIPLLFNSIKAVTDWLKKNGLTQIPENVTQFVNTNDNYQAIKTCITEAEEVCKILQADWNIFESKELHTSLSFEVLARLYPNLCASINNKIKLYKAILDIRKDKTYTATVSELKNDAREIDKLFQELEQLNAVGLRQLFDNENIIEEVIAEPDILKSLSDNFQNLLLIVNSANYRLPKDITVGQAVDFTQQAKLFLSSCQEWLEKYDSEIVELDHLFENDHSIEDLEALKFSDFSKKIVGMLEDQEGLERWVTYRRYAQQLREMNCLWFLEETQGRTVSNPVSLFAQTLWSTWLEAYYADKLVLKNFSVKDHSKLIKEFQILEQQVLEVNAFRIMEIYGPELKIAKRFGGDQEKELIHQSQLKQRHKPIRRVVRETGQRLLRYKPCWMMSPLTLSSYIPYGYMNFDVVIFDEASQMRVEHALGAIARAKQVVIFGDENQLPPTSFFELNGNDGDENDDADAEDYESILHATKEILPGAFEMLNHHYRSKYEDLIAFSNYYVYDGRLITFPNPAGSHRAVNIEFVANGVFDGGSEGSRRNTIEAERVVEICAKQVAEEPNKSLGVIAFSRSQEAAIRDCLEEFLKRNPQFQDKLDENSDNPESFFIKNLESVQGDERDVIIMSVGYGKDKKTGEVYNRFGPINSQHGYRRLNVAVTRAKDKVICVTSMKASDIRNAEKSRGALLLQKYLEYAERGMPSIDASLLVQNQQGIQVDSPFEEEVERSLQARGYTIHRQIGASGFKIDLAIVNPKKDQEYILGIECDGASYHSSYSARMNDRIRQEILEHLGWKIYRIWSQHWISHKEEIIDDIIRKIN